MRSLRALVMGAAMITGASALASAQPLPQNWNHGYKDRDHDRDHDRNRDRRVNGYYDRGYYNNGYYNRDDWRWRDRDDRRYRDRDDWRWKNHNRDWDHDGDRR
jgi:hypothetical protein